MRSFSVKKILREPADYLHSGALYSRVDLKQW